jgi:hypothetical protein
MSRPHGLLLVRNHRRICPAELEGAAQTREPDRRTMALMLGADCAGDRLYPG